MTRPPPTSMPGATDSASASRELEVMAGMVRYPKWLLSPFLPHLGRYAVEVGAGSGNVTRTLLEAGVECIEAIEPDAFLFKQLCENFSGVPSVRPHNAFAADILPKLQGHPDSVIYINVLEHIEDDARELALAHAALREGGKLCVFVPAMKVLYSEYDHAMGHFRRYEKNALAKLCMSAGFKVVELKYFDLAGAFAWWLHFRLLGRMGQSSNCVGLYDRLVVPATKTLETFIDPPFGKNLVLVAEKPENDR